MCDDPLPPAAAAEAAQQSLPSGERGLQVVGPLILVALAALLLAAHFWRAANIGLAGVCAALPLLLLARRRWVAQLFVVALVLGGLLWTHAAWQLVRARLDQGLPWARLAAILGGVALLTAAAALLFRAPALRRRFGGGADSATASTAAFGATFALLAVVQLVVQRPLLLAERWLPSAGWAQIFLLSLYAAWIVEQLLAVERAALWRRRLWLAFSIVFFSQLALGLLGYTTFLMRPGELHFPIPALIVAGPLFRGERFFMLVLFLTTVILVGPAWCSFVCYVGGWDLEAARRAGKPRRLSRRKHRVRLSLLLSLIAVTVALRLGGASIAVAGSLALAFGLVGVGVMLLWSRRKGTMTHCALYCPIGLLANCLGKVSPFRIRIGDGCDACGRCMLACRYDALHIEDVRARRPNLSCTLCGDCLARCPSDQLSYRWLGLSPRRSRTAFLVLVVVLHAAALGLARV